MTKATKQQKQDETQFKFALKIKQKNMPAHYLTRNFYRLHDISVRRIKEALKLNPETVKISALPLYNEPKQRYLVRTNNNIGFIVGINNRYLVCINILKNPQLQETITHYNEDKKKRLNLALPLLNTQLNLFKRNIKTRYSIKTASQLGKKTIQILDPWHKNN